MTMDMNAASKIRTLLECKQDIKDTLYRHQQALDSLKNTRNVPINAVLQLAQNLAYSGHAPPGWVPGAPLINSHPPAIQPHEMRGGMLEKHNIAHPTSSSGPVTENVATTKAEDDVKDLVRSIFLRKQTILQKRAYEQELAERQKQEALLREAEDAERAKHEAMEVVAAEEDTARIVEAVVETEKQQQTEIEPPTKIRKTNISFASYSDEESSDEES